MELTWRPIALEDLHNIRRYIAQNNPAAAERVRGAILQSVERLANFPGLGRTGRVDGTRELVIPNTPYIVAYTVIGGRVMILSVIHSARDWPDRF
jgi:toxin ParE1/3/4